MFTCLQMPRSWDELAHIRRKTKQEQCDSAACRAGLSFDLNELVRGLID